MNRGSKSLVETDWLGNNHQSKFTAAALLKLLDTLHIDTELDWRQPVTRTGATHGGLWIFRRIRIEISTPRALNQTILFFEKSWLGSQVPLVVPTIPETHHLITFSAQGLETSRPMAAAHP